MDDELIVKLYWDRSEHAISETSRKYGAYCHSIAYGILQSREDTEVFTESRSCESEFPESTGTLPSKSD